uniref:Uncharacterized protein n=1 Tax=Rhizophora mucronata TaxID=61149 RepID=A0A2P2PTT6_RHIMU
MIYDCFWSYILTMQLENAFINLGSRLSQYGENFSSILC